MGTPVDSGTQNRRIPGGGDLTAGITGLPGLAALALANVALFVFDRYVAKELAREEGAGPDEA